MAAHAKQNSNYVTKQ